MGVDGGITFENKKIPPELGYRTQMGAIILLSYSKLGGIPAEIHPIWVG